MTEVESIIVALIGVGGVVVGTILAEVIQYFRKKSDEVEVVRKKNSLLVATYYELMTNLDTIKGFNKTFVVSDNLQTKTEMLSTLRTCYNILPLQLVNDIEHAYSGINTQSFYIKNTGGIVKNPNLENETTQKIGNALNSLEIELKKIGLFEELKASVTEK